MCGIAGFVTSGEREPATIRSQVESMVASIHHRGPDANGVELIPSRAGDVAALGAVRLRIIDLNPSADQPLADSESRVWTVFNGEIYNYIELRRELSAKGYRFATSTDTECLVYAYLDSNRDVSVMASRLRGMFAFAIWDVELGRLCLVRDRLGIKPLYWTVQGTDLAFGSEQRSLATAGFVSGQPRLEAVGAFLSKGCVPQSMPILEGIRSVKPGHAVTWTRSGITETRWWKPQFEPRPEFDSDEAAIGAISQTVGDAVRRHLVADRTVGIFLSSGVDSTAVATFAAEAGSPQTLTVTFPDSKVPDEGAAARATSNRLGLEHLEVPVTAARAVELMPKIVGDLDSPSIDGFNSWLVSQAASEAGLVVVLSGLGGDELLAGYRTFTLVPRLAPLTQLQRLVPNRLRRAAARRMHERGGLDRIGRVLSSDPGLPGAYQAVRGVFSCAELNALGFPAAPAPLWALPKNPVDAVTLMELTTYLPDQLLADTDSVSMAHSLEARVPLLDDAIVELALAIPARTRVAGKQLLARAAGFTKPATKETFALPMERWIKTELRDFVRDGLLDDALPFDDLLPAAFRRSTWNAFESSRAHWSKAWAVAVLRRWPGANNFNW